jgi:DnaJ-class molecular chaperone
MRIKIYVVCPECHGKGHVAVDVADSGQGAVYADCQNCDGRGEALDATQDHPKAKRIEVIA